MMGGLNRSPAACTLALGRKERG
ncbi:hypothetical protein NC653_038277 [Populus alba x Populus x berolinensis]|uniref:Uncharacterized protein n=1 Tax=Populus alba x Populus x berolinensis TaxID=444605 RepID=A0AAD6PT60_9ROSI|nr:hypothetical protein NC653_038277 [Populus alba x Populus x berolinensis]